MQSTWGNRDLPVLAAVAEILDEEHVTDPNAIVAASGLGDEQVQRALRALSAEDPPLIEVKNQNGYITMVWGLTGEARRRVGAWPTSKDLADRIVEALNDAAEQASNPQDSTRLRNAGKALASVGQAALAGVISNALTGSPLGPA